MYMQHENRLTLLSLEKAHYRAIHVVQISLQDCLAISMKAMINVSLLIDLGAPMVCGRLMFSDVVLYVLFDFTLISLRKRVCSYCRMFCFALFSYVFVSNPLCDSVFPCHVCYDILGMTFYH